MKPSGLSFGPHCLLISGLICICSIMFSGTTVFAESLYSDQSWPALASDQRARNVGDIVTVLIYEPSSASNTARNGSRKSNKIGGSISGGPIREQGELSFGGSYTGQAEAKRSGRVVAQISVTVKAALPNGDFLIAGNQVLKVNGETTDIGIRGRVRQADLTSDNRILSSRIADAQINYDGKGFVSRSAKPGLVTRIFQFLGLS